MKKEKKYSMESFTHWYAYQKRLILGEKGVQMCGIEYYTDILKHDTSSRQKIRYFLWRYNDIGRNIKTFDIRLVWYLISLFIPILIPGADLYTSPTLVQTSNFRVTSFWQAFIHQQSDCWSLYSRTRSMQRDSPNWSCAQESMLTMQQNYNLENILENQS
jgi:hypothetical protein